ncbi:N-terminal EF-hand calcium-binding protein 3, partial [Fulmarus glacialis]
IFRRADKNDDGKLSFEEFKNYFADGILSSEELWELFSGIDRCHSDNVDTEKLCGKNMLWLCVWELWFEAVPPKAFLVLRIPTSVHAIVVAAGQGNWTGSMACVSGCLLTGRLLDLLSAVHVVNCRIKRCDKQAGFVLLAVKDIKKSETSVGLRSGRRCGRRGQKNVCLSPTDPYSGMLTTGENSCHSIALCKVCAVLVGSGHEHPKLTPDETKALPPSTAPELQTELRMEPRPVPLAPGPGGTNVAAPCQPPTQGCSCLRSVSACKLTDEACFILYEFWQDVTSWRSHLQSSCSKTFQRAIISLLESPELLTTMLFPASWWIMNNN